MNEVRKRGFGALQQTMSMELKERTAVVQSSPKPCAVKLGHSADTPAGPPLFCCLVHITARTLVTCTGLFESLTFLQTHWFGDVYTV